MSTMAKFAGGFSDAPPAPWMFALAGREHSKRYVKIGKEKTENITLSLHPRVKLCEQTWDYQTAVC